MLKPSQLLKYGSATLQESTLVPKKKSVNSIPLRVGHWITLTNEAEIIAEVVVDDGVDVTTDTNINNKIFTEDGFPMRLRKGYKVLCVAYTMIKHSSWGQMHDVSFYQMQDGKWINDFNVLYINKAITEKMPNKKSLHAEPVCIRCAVEYVEKEEKVDKLLGATITVHAMLYGTTKPRQDNNPNLSPKDGFRVAYGEREINVESEQIKIAKVRNLRL